MAEDAMFPCIVCGITLKNSFKDTDNQPSEGTEFRTYGHYGSTFWDDMPATEELVLNVCDKCLKKHKDRLGRQRRARVITCRGQVVGRLWVKREMVPYYEGVDNEPDLEIDPVEIGDSEKLNDRVEWIMHWRLSREALIAADEEEMKS